MSKKNKNGKRTNDRKGGRSDRPQETRVAEAVTVAWMLTTLVTLVAELGGVIGWLILFSAAQPQKVERGLALLPGVVLYIGLISGLVVLLLTPVTYRVRRVRPPTSVTVTALLIGLAPLATILVLSRFQ